MAVERDVVTMISEREGRAEVGTLAQRGERARGRGGERCGCGRVRVRGGFEGCAIRLQAREREVGGCTSEHM